MKKKVYVLMPGDDFNLKVHLKAKTFTYLKIEAIEVDNVETGVEDFEL